MLRISEAGILGEVVTLRLEGQIIGPWVKELRRSCEAFLGSGRRVCLDVGEVSFADREGAALLRDLIERQVALVRCPPFLAIHLGNAGSGGNQFE